jgi:hypothetical protein
MLPQAPDTVKYVWQSHNFLPRDAENHAAAQSGNPGHHGHFQIQCQKSKSPVTGTGLSA